MGSWLWLYMRWLCASEKMYTTIIGKPGVFLFDLECEHGLSQGSQQQMHSSESEAKNPNIQLSSQKTPFPDLRS